MTSWLEAAVFLFPHLNFILCDADRVPLSLFEVKDLINLASLISPEREMLRKVLCCWSQSPVCVSSRNSPRPRLQ